MVRVGIIADTRQQAGKHGNIDGWLSAHGVPFSYRKLDYGDYRRDDGFGNVSVDTKQGMQEVAGNIGRDHARFRRECERARAAGWRLVILVEEHAEYNDRSMLSTWVSGVCRRCPKYRSRACSPLVDKCTERRVKPLQGETAAKIITTLEERTGVRFEFCSKRNTARRICELLGVGYDTE